MSIKDMVEAGVAKQSAQILQWKHGYEGRAPNAENCAALERATWKWAHRNAIRATLSVEALRPDLRWTRIPDNRWPNPKGRPVLEVAIAA